MLEITFIHPDGTAKTVEAPEHWSVMQVAVEHKIPGIEAVCGGAMACATCHVYVHPDWVERVVAEDNEQSDEEQDMLDLAFDVRQTSRLSCQLKITEKLNGLIVALPGTKTGW